LHRTECLQTHGTPESERPKVTALNLLKLPLRIAELPGEVIIFRIVSLRDTLPAHQTASPPFQKVGFLRLRHSLKEERGIIEVRGCGQSLFDKAMALL
jgi:hypothetical protein